MKDQWNELPKPVKWLVGLIGAGGLFAWGTTSRGSFNWQFGLLLVLLLFIVVGGYALLRWFNRRRKSARLRREIFDIPVPPSTVPNPQDVAKLDELKRKFLKGIEQYRRLGRDLYVVPWYLIVGESGSGKSQAVRHSEQSFPPGMQEDYQGVGGTIGMDWWFTNHAVLIDTAGSLVFEKVKPGETGAWREFLGLLKKHRPHCPVNGLLLVIPADSLIKDPLNVVAEKAQHLARQLQIIQRELDVCFPVFVVVTKSDLISGYREFFQNLNDALQHQILGWSNPELIDETVKADRARIDAEEHERKLKKQITDGLGGVETQLKKCRLGMLRESMPANPQDRRADEVDSLYAFPRNLMKLEEPLWIYLRHIFARGPFYRPLFFRGIYFNSSMQEGAALDEQLAESLSLPVGALPGGSAFRQDRAFFLRDLFKQKIFGESGLVIRATNTLQRLRAWQIAFYCCAVGAVLFWLILAATGKSSLETGVGTQSDYFGRVKDKDPSKDEWFPFQRTNLLVWHPIVEAETGKFLGDQLIRVGEDQVSLVEFHARLRDQADTPIQIKKRFWPIATFQDPNRDRQRAQRITFEASVIKPLLLLTRQKLQTPPDPRMGLGEFSTPELGRHIEALKSLLRLESQISEHRDRSFSPVSKLTRNEALEYYLRPWLTFVIGEAPRESALTNLAATMARTYAPTNLQVWPPPVSQGISLEENRTISNALARLMVNVRSQLQTGQELKRIQTLTLALGRYLSFENQFVEALRKSQPTDMLYTNLSHEVGVWTNSLAAAKTPVGALSTNPYSVAAGYHASQGGAKQQYRTALAPIAELATRLAGMNSGQASSLFADITNRLNTFLKTEVLAPFEDAPLMLSQLRDFDRVYLAKYGPDGRHLFQVRWDAYHAVREYTCFPLILTAETNSLGAAEVLNAGVVFRDLDNDLNATNLTSRDLPAEHVAMLTPLRDKLEQLRPMARALTPSNQIATCQISVLTNGSSLKGWQGIRFSAAGKSTPPLRIPLFPSLGSVKLNESFGIKLLQYALPDPSYTHDLVESPSDWKVLRWLLAHRSGAERQAGGTNWILTIPAPEPGGKTTNSIRFKLEFNTALPELEKWPHHASTPP